MLKDRLIKFDLARERLDKTAGSVINSNHKKIYLDASNAIMSERLMSIYLNNCFYVSERTYNTVRCLIDYFKGMTELRYPTEQYFTKAVHARGVDFKKMVGLDEGNSINPICITGRSGDGKTKLLEFLYGLFHDCDRPIKNQAGKFGNFGWDSFSAEGCTSATSIVSQTRFAQDGCSIGDYGKLCYANGVIGFGVDELQFTTKSKAANSKVTSLLLSLRSYAVPWIYACNYSLLWKLLKRNQEDVARIIPKVIHISPAGWEGEAGIEAEVAFTEKILQEIDELVPNNRDIILQKLVQLSGSSPRYLRDILSLANRIRFNKDRPKICIDCIEKAYLSTEFSVQRAQIELMNSGADYLIRKGRFDLVIPPEFDSADVLTSPYDLHAEQYKILTASLTKSEKRKNTSTYLARGGKMVTVREMSKKERLQASYKSIETL